MRSKSMSPIWGKRLLIPVLIQFSASITQSSTPSWDEPNKAWRNGPVRFILTSDEDKYYKGLKTDQDRARAVADFWAIRDPNPDTPANEFRVDFYARVDDANKEFSDGAVRGWASDRGRVLLVAGYPKQRIKAKDQETWFLTFKWPGARGQDPGGGTVRVYFQWNSGAMEWHMGSQALQLLDQLADLEPRRESVLSMPTGTLKPSNEP